MKMQARNKALKHLAETKQRLSDVRRTAVIQSGGVSIRETGNAN